MPGRVGGWGPVGCGAGQLWVPAAAAGWRRSQEAVWPLSAAILPTILASRLPLPETSSVGRNSSGLPPARWRASKSLRCGNLHL